MDITIARRALALADKKAEENCGIIFFGGEPLLKKELINEIVREARVMEKNGSCKFHFKITTNGLLLDEDFIEFSKKQNILIAMSMDGIREAHDKHRILADGMPTFNKLEHTLGLLMASKPYSSIILIVNPDTAEYLSDSVKYLIGKNVRYVICSLNYAAYWDENDFIILEKEYKKLSKSYIRWTKENKKFYFSMFETKLSSHVNAHCYEKERCELGERQLSIAPDGSLYPCVQFTKAGSQSEWCIGNVFDGLDEGARKDILNKSKKEKDGCKDCQIASRCNNTCGCLNWQTTFSINDVSPVLCKNERILIPIVDNIGNILFKKKIPLFIHKNYHEEYPIFSLIDDIESEKTKKGSIKKRADSNFE